MDNYSNNINNQVHQNTNNDGAKVCIAIGALVTSGVAVAAFPMCTNISIPAAALMSSPLFCGAATISACEHNYINCKEYLETHCRVCIGGNDQPIELQEMQ